MAKTITTSIRLSADIRNQLEQASNLMHRGKNWIINEALQSYLRQLKLNTFTEEAKRQSLLASKANMPETDSWEKNADQDGWIA